MIRLSLCFIVCCFVFASLQASQINKDAITGRLAQHQTLSEYLENLTENEVIKILAAGKFIHAGIGGSTLKVEINGIPLFVKQIPLNELENRPENFMSTENLFELPLFYQYGIGSAGFNAWRELVAHQMTTDWVLSGETENFPLMYHWRVIKKYSKKLPLDEAALAKQIQFWEGSTAVEERTRANYHASSYITVFMEFFPDNLKSWLNKEWEKDGEQLDKSIQMVEENLIEITEFLRSKEMLHFDAHFQNIMTDGKQLYFADFGLSTSTKFHLAEDELKFFKQHIDYDQRYVKTSLANWLVTHMYGVDRQNVNQILKCYVENEIPPVSPQKKTPLLDSIVKRHASTAIKMNDFFDVLLNETRLALYPEE